MEKKINDFFQNALVHDMQCIAYAYRPINTVNDGRIPFLNPSDDEDEDPGCAFVVLPYKPPSSDSSDSSSESSSESSLHHSNGKQPANIENAPKSRRTSKGTTASISRSTTASTTNSSGSSESSETGSSDYSFEEDEPVDEQEEATFYKEVVKGQIFLGMTAMCHQPKQVSVASPFRMYIYIYTNLRAMDRMWLISLRTWGLLVYALCISQPLLKESRKVG